MRVRLVLLGALAALSARAEPLSVRPSFVIGSAEGLQCAVQSLASDPGAPGPFDRAYAVTCRDAAAPVGRVYALRAKGDPLARLAALRAGKVQCAASGQDCRVTANGIGYSVLTDRAGRTVYAAEGLKGYEDALKLALTSIMADRVVAGRISAASTAATDAAAFARAQAASLDGQAALAEAYRRNNGGAYAESAEFFDVISTGRREGVSLAEALLGAALQQSNLQAYAAADALIARVPAADQADPVTGRVARNVRAIQHLNQNQPDAALAELAKPLPAAAMLRPVSAAVIDGATARALNRKAKLAGDPDRLTPEERTQILDAQSVQLKGSALRLAGRDREARAAFEEALALLAKAATERAVSVARLESATLAEYGRLVETQGDLAGAEQWQLRALAAIETEFPGSLAALSARARLATIVARRGRIDAALDLYRQVVSESARTGSVSPGVGANLPAYFELLSTEVKARPALAADFFAAAQLLVRPGVAQTQAVLARELSGGSDEAARLFRQATTLTREVERARVELGRLTALDEPTPEEAARGAQVRAELDALAQQQSATTAELARFPRYRAVSTATLALADLQKALRPGEAYLKLTMAGPKAWGLLVTPTAARIYPLGASPAELTGKVAALRASIVQVEDGQTLTPPFDASLAWQLFQDIAGPVAADLTRVTHLIYEPDGALLKLPPGVLIADKAGLDAYLTRRARPGADPFDMRGVEWLARRVEVTTAVSPLAFRDLRQAPPAEAKRPYLGFGQNASPTPAAVERARAAGGLVGAAGDGCGWPLAQWSVPIAPDELRLADRLLGGGPRAVVTGAAFTDTALLARPDLGEARILHFATHGLVTAPKPGCPARPALVTSFGDGDSDGLLSFAEIYDLKLNADLVVLSACDTAGEASAGVAREAGLAGGGEFALDGLVRAFVGAGGRTVVASHWPVPDDYGATAKLIGALFEAKPGVGVGDALKAGQRALMDAAETSHPFYWAAFAVIGDATRPVVPR